MDNVTKHKQLVKRLLTEIADRFRQSNRWEIMEAFDEERGQYLLFTDGWQGEQREYGCFMHLEVKPNGKIWLRRDGTDLDIGQQLLDEGVAKSNLVLAFHSPRTREWSDFAVS
jgi:hypothetical protein